MRLHKISTENAVFQGFEALKHNRSKRHRRGAFFVEGVRNIDAAARYGWNFEAFIVCGGAKLSRWGLGLLAAHVDADIYELAPDLMRKLSSKVDTSEVVAIVTMRRRLRPLPQEGSDVYVLFDRPSGKGNLGTLMRSCDAFGIAALYSMGHSVDFYDPEVIAASMGSFFTVPFCALSEARDIDDLFAYLRQVHPGLLVVGTSARGGQAIYDVDLTGPVLLLIGNEADGLSWRLKQAADVMAAIPMSDCASASSLNVSCAATAVLYEVYRQRLHNETIAYHDDCIS